MIDIETLLRACGVLAERTYGKWNARCPNPEHDDSKPSWSIVDSPNGENHGSHFCFSCKWGGGPWELGAACWKVSNKEAGARIKSMFSDDRPIHVPEVVIRMHNQTGFKLPIGVTIPEPGMAWPQTPKEYLLDRGVTEEQISRWGIGFALWGRCARRVVIPVYTEGKLRTFSARAYAPGIHRYEAGRSSDGAQPKRAIWGEPRFVDGQPVTVAEGIFSALALERAGAPNPCAILGSNLTPEKARMLSRFDRVIVATDPDKAGDGVADFLATLGRRANVARLRVDKSPDDVSHETLKEAVAKSLDALSNAA